MVIFTSRDERRKIQSEGLLENNGYKKYHKNAQNFQLTLKNNGFKGNIL